MRPATGQDASATAISEWMFRNGENSEYAFTIDESMARPRTVSDAALLAAAQRAITRRGPIRVTLADVAREAGLAPPTLVQRFGSKRRLLLAVAQSGVAGVPAGFAAARAANASPLAALLAAAVALTGELRTAFLLLDLGERDFRELALETSRRTVAGYRALLDEAVAAAELIPCATARLARAVAAVSGGATMNWAIGRAGAAEQWVRDDLAMLLDPYRITPFAPTGRGP